MLSELFHTDGLFLMIGGQRITFRKWKWLLKTMVFKVNLGMTEVMVSGDIEKDELYKINVYQCRVCSLRVKNEFCV